MAFEKKPMLKLTKFSLITKLGLGVTTVVAFSIIWFVHWSQGQERAQLHQGVIKDEIRQNYKKMFREELRESTLKKEKPKSSN